MKAKYKVIICMLLIVSTAGIAAATFFEDLITVRDSFVNLLQPASASGYIAYRGYTIGYCNGCTIGSYYYVRNDPVHSYNIVDSRGRTFNYQKTNAPRYPYNANGLAQAKSRVDSILVTSPTATPAVTYMATSAPVRTPAPTSAPSQTPQPSVTPLIPCPQLNEQYGTLARAADTNNNNYLSPQEAGAYISNQYFARITQLEASGLIKIALQNCQITAPAATPKPKIIPAPIATALGIPQSPGYEVLGAVAALMLVFTIRRKYEK